MRSGIAPQGPCARVTGVVYRFGCLLLKRAKIIKNPDPLGGRLKQQRRLVCPRSTRRRRIALPYESRTSEVQPGAEQLWRWNRAGGRSGATLLIELLTERSDRTEVGEKLHLIRGMRV